MTREIRSEITSLADAYSQERLDEGGLERLEELLRSDRRNLQIYVEYMDELAVLDERLKSTPELYESSSFLKRDHEKAQSPGLQRGLLFSNVGLTLLLMCAVLGTYQFVVPWTMSWLEQTSRPVARIVSSTGGKWSIASSDRDRLPHGGGGVSRHDVLFENDTIHLEHGLLEIRFDNQVKLFLHGETSCRLTGTNSAYLVEGKAASEVPRSGIGFRLDCSSLDVCDLGTRFSLISDDRGNAELSVAEGHVMASIHEESPEKKTWQSVHTQQTVTYMPNIGFLEKIPYRSNVFAYIDAAAQGISDFSGHISVCRSAEELQGTSMQIRVLPVARSVRFSRKVSFDLGQGTWAVDSSSVGGFLPEDFACDIYHFRLACPAGEVTKAAGNFRFAQPILGVVVTPQNLSELEATFPFAGLQFHRDESRGLEQLTEEDTDSVAISVDRYKLEVQLSATSLDEFYVITAGN